MEQVVIRRVLPGDVLALQKIARDTFFDTFAAVNTPENMAKYLEEVLSPEKVAEELTNEYSAFYFAVLSDKIIGYLKLNTGPSQTELKEENAVEIERIYVIKEFHGKQVGQLLYEKAVAVAREMQADYIWLGVWEENPRAIRFYQKNGFVEFGKHTFKLGDDEQTDIMMKLELTKQ